MGAVKHPWIWGPAGTSSEYRSINPSQSQAGRAFCKVPGARYLISSCSSMLARSSLRAYSASHLRWAPGIQRPASLGLQLYRRQSPSLCR